MYVVCYLPLYGYHTSSTTVLSVNHWNLMLKITRLWSGQILLQLMTSLRAAIAQSVERLPTGWTVRGSNPGGGEIFRTCTDRPWGPPSLLYNGYRVFFPEVKRSERDVNHPPHLAARLRKSRALPIFSRWTERGLLYLATHYRVENRQSSYCRS